MAVNSPILQDEFIAPQSGIVKQAVIFLHGYGSNCQDLLSIGESWAEALTDTVFISPDAPDACESFPVGHQWFSIRALENDIAARERQIVPASAILDRYIDAQLVKWQLAERQIAVVGFSQGAMMALYTMPRRKNPCAAVVAYSGMLIGGDGLTGSAIVKPPVLAVHGSADEVVRPESLGVIQKELSAAGFAVESVMRPQLGHGIDAVGLNRGLEFIRKAFLANQ